MTKSGYASATISSCLQYRYRLERGIEMGNSATVAWIMVNPSTADAETDDATIRKVMGFSERMGAGRLIVGNLFAYRATDVRRLADDAIDPVGPENDQFLKTIISNADLVIVAWGPTAKLPLYLRQRYKRVIQIADKLDKPLYCFGIAKDGHPRHPLMLAYSTPMTTWSPPDA